MKKKPGLTKREQRIAMKAYEIGVSDGDFSIAKYFDLPGVLNEFFRACEKAANLDGRKVNDGR